MLIKELIKSKCVVGKIVPVMCIYRYWCTGYNQRGWLFTGSLPCSLYPQILHAQVEPGHGVDILKFVEPMARRVVTDDLHPSITYTGAWISEGPIDSVSNEYNGTVHKTITAGSSISFPFTGEYIARILMLILSY
jgi:hypothetical protein